MNKFKPGDIVTVNQFGISIYGTNGKWDGIGKKATVIRNANSQVFIGKGLFGDGKVHLIAEAFDLVKPNEIETYYEWLKSDVEKQLLNNY